MHTVVVCIGTSHPGNVGAIARGAANFGVTDLRFVSPRCDVRCQEALDRAVHAKQSLLDAMVCDSLEEALEGVSLSVGTTARYTTADNRFLRKPMDVRDWTETLADWDGTLGLVFGREDSGLNAEEVNALDQLVTVPTSEYSSLNLAHAVTLLCYEAFRMSADRVEWERTLAPDTLGSMNQAWDDIVECTEARTWRRDVARGIWRKIIGRSTPSDYEVHNIMGILGNVLKRFDHPDWRTEASSRKVHRDGLFAESVGSEEE